MGRSSRCADCDATVVVTAAKTQVRGGTIVLVCPACAGVEVPVPEPIADAPSGAYDEVVIEMDDDLYGDDVEAVAGPIDGVFHGEGDAAISGAVEVADRPPRQRDPTLPPVVVDKPAV